MYTLGTKNLKDTSSWHSIQVLHNYILILGSFQTFILVLSSWLMVLGLVVVIAAIISFDFYILLSTTTNTRATDILNPQKSQTKMTTLFRKKSFMLDEMFQWNTSKIICHIFWNYENPHSFIFVFHFMLLLYWDEKQTQNYDVGFCIPKQWHILKHFSGTFYQA